MRNVHSQNLTVRDRCQVAAFHAVWKQLRRAEKKRLRCVDFAEAIVKSSDEKFREADPALVQEWVEKYGGCRSRKRGGE